MEALPRSLVRVPSTPRHPDAEFRGLKDSQDKADTTGVKSLSLADFCELLKWGIIMGVFTAYTSGFQDFVSGG